MGRMGKKRMEGRVRNEGGRTRKQRGAMEDGKKKGRKGRTWRMGRRKRRGVETGGMEEGEGGGERRKGEEGRKGTKEGRRGKERDEETNVRAGRKEKGGSKG